MTSCGGGGVPSGSNCGSGMIHSNTGTSYIFIQGNTLSYAGNTPGNPVGLGMDLAESGGGDHYLVENNDLSHYDIGIKFNNQYGVFRNNTFHDQLDAEGCENGHTNQYFSEPGVSITVQHNLMEGNYQRNAVGANSKTILAQNDNNKTCPNCSHIISRYNTVSRIGSGAASNYYWPQIMVYNNTVVDALSDSGATNGTADYAQYSTNGSYLNQLYYFSFKSGTNFNVYWCGSGCNYGHSLYWCTGSCTSVWGHQAGVPFLNYPANLNADPKFVKYVGFGKCKPTIITCKPVPPPSRQELL